MTEEEIADLSRYLELRFSDPEDSMRYHTSIYHWFAKIYSVVPDMTVIKNYLNAYDRAEWQKELDEKKPRVAELEDLLKPGVG